MVFLLAIENSEPWLLKLLHYCLNGVFSKTKSITAGTPPSENLYPSGASAWNSFNTELTSSNWLSEDELAVASARRFSNAGNLLRGSALRSNTSGDNIVPLQSRRVERKVGTNLTVKSGQEISTTHVGEKTDISVSGIANEVSFGHRLKGACTLTPTPPPIVIPCIKATYWL